MSPRLNWAFVLGLVLAVAGCDIPKDPDGTLERVQESGVLRVAASPAEGRVVVDGDDVTGVEADLAEGFADSLGATVEWHVMGEEPAVEAMDRGEVDLLIGGLTDKNPHSAKVGATRAYATTTEHGEQVKHVMAVPMGENAMQSALERYLDEETP